MNFVKGKKYKRLEIDFSLSVELNQAIDTFLNHINNESGTSEDCLRTEILFWLKDYQSHLTQEQFDLLKDYYVHKGIYKE